jgi:hypothetical protein
LASLDDRAGIRERLERDCCGGRRCDRGVIPHGGRVELRHPEVEDLGLSGTCDEDVRRLDVPVHDSSGVRGRERIGDLGGELDDFVGRERPPFDVVLERFTLQHLHDDVMLDADSAFGRADVANRADEDR